MAEETLGYLPLYFLLQKPFVRPFSETMTRFPSVCVGILAVALMAQVGRRLWGREAGLASALLLALSPFHVWFSRDAGFYALMALSSVGTWHGSELQGVRLTHFDSPGHSGGEST